MRLKCNISSCFDSNGLKEYGVLPGATITDCYNEQLDSGSIVIVHLSERLPLNPYDWVRLYSEEQSGGSPIFERVMLIDSYAERKINLLQPYYEYTIELMSETKLLEKIQLPNRQWQHSLANDVPTQKTISQAMRETLECYVPKIKAKRTAPVPPYFQWYYLIDFSDLSDPSSDIYKRFDVPLADLSLSQPTLRECLTAMMSQVGCIPTVRNGMLSYLDFRANPRTMTLNGSFAQEQRSNASDSYVSELVNTADSVLDTGNSSISETLRFTDRNRAFLKQLENLYLETRYPIYKVTKLDINAWTSTKLQIEMKPTGDLDDFILDDVGYAYNYDEGVWKPRARFYNTGSGYFEVSERKLIFGTLDSEGIFHITSTKTKGSTLTIDPIASAQDEWWDYPEASDPNIDMIYVAKVQIRPGQHEKHLFWRFSFGATFDPVAGRYWWTTGKFTLLFKTDITPLCVEQTKRQLLKTNFLEMTQGNITDMESLSKYYYGTVGYQIGGKTIEGWSDTYTYTAADWWEAVTVGGVDRTRTYIENITNRLLYSIKESDYMNTAFLNETFFGFDVLTSDNWKYDSLSVIGYDPDDDDAPINYANWFFDIEYQPLNSLAVRYTKSKDTPIPFQQLDTQRDAISSMDYLSAHESEKVDRLGNPIISLSQYARNETIWWLGSRPLTYEGNAIFQITYSFDWEGTAVNYFGSENYIIRDYFTGIQTKYRAYRYVDYSQAVTRKENRKEYVLITQKNYNDMSLNASFGSIDGHYKFVAKAGLASPFGADCRPLEIGVMGYLYQGAEWSCYKNERSIVTFKTSIILNQEEFDNASAGLMLSDDDNYQDIGGGVPQAWYMWRDGAYDSRVIGWMGSIDPLYGVSPINPSQSDLNDALEKIAKLPLISNMTQMPYEGDFNTPAVRINMPLYKDWSELLNVSLQFEYYTDDPDVEFGEWFADAIKWRESGWALCAIEDDAWHAENPFGGEHDGSPTVGDTSAHLHIEPDYGSFTIDSWPVQEGNNYILRLALKKGTKIRDVAMFTLRNYPTVSEKTYYIKPNGSKTTKVYERINNMWVLNGDVSSV